MTNTTAPATVNAARQRWATPTLETLATAMERVAFNPNIAGDGGVESSGTSGSPV